MRVDVRGRRVGSSTLVDLRVQTDAHLPASAAGRIAEAVRMKILAAVPGCSEVLVAASTEASVLRV